MLLKWFQFLRILHHQIRLYKLSEDMHRNNLVAENETNELIMVARSIVIAQYGGDCQGNVALAAQNLTQSNVSKSGDLSNGMISKVVVKETIGFEQDARVHEGIFFSAIYFLK
ncbi:hypothetical protein ACOSQ2_026122 [Xanthoceras sorbifolium]